MSEPDPYASPYHQVNLPGQPNAPVPPGYFPQAPMSAVDVRDSALPRPTTTTVAFWCWIAGAVLVVIVLPALLYTRLDALVDNAEGTAPTTTEAEIGARLTPIVLMVGFAVVSVPFVLAAFMLRSGRNWARVLLTVLGVFGGLFGFFMLLMFAVADPEFLHWGLGTAWALLLIAACSLGIVAMYLPASNAYVKSVTR